MEGLLENPVSLWFVAGLVLIVIEAIVPGVVVIFFAFGAWITSLVTWLIPMPFEIQLIVFLVTSVLSLVALRRYVSKWFIGEMGNVDSSVNDFIGKEAEVTRAIDSENLGQVVFKGVEWQAESTQVLEVGDRVIITDQKSIRLIVERK